MAWLDRRSLLFGTAAFAFAPGLATAAVTSPTPQILLVCQFGTVKSPIARELLKRRAAERHIPLRISARGITPQQHITPELLGRLAKDGINPAAEPLRKLGKKDIAAADLVIAFDRLPTEYRPRRLEDWSDLPSMLNDYDHARADLDARIDGLLSRLSRRQAPFLP
jgi:protein-tyrosine-phosphatase